jgi:gliding motility-associated-like protein
MSGCLEIGELNIKINIRMIKLLKIVIVLIFISGATYAQVVCNDFTITGTTVSGYFASQSALCALSPVPTGNLIWTDTPLNGNPNGFIKHTFNSPQTNVTIGYTVVNSNDVGTISVNGGGVITVTSTNACATVSGNLVGPYIGAGAYGDIQINITSTLPFTEVTLINTGGQSGIVSGDCNSVIINADSCQFSFGNDITLCQNDSVVLNAATPNSTYLWQNNSTDSIFTVTQSGTYWVQITNANCTLSDTINVNFTPLPVVDLGSDTVLCQGNILTLDVTTPNASYVWQDNSLSPVFTVNQPGFYWVDVTVNNCSSRDSILVNYNPLSQIDIGNDTTLCQGEILVLDATVPVGTYQWQDNSNGATYSLTQAGLYWVQISNGDCSVSDSIFVNYTNLPVVNLGNDTSICQGEIVSLNVGLPGASYQWQDNSINSVYTVVQQGLYWVEVTLNNCSSTDSVFVAYTPLPVVNLGNDTTLCEGESLLLDASTTNATYLWQDNSGNSQFTVEQSGLYSVQVSVNNCSSSDSLQVDFTALPVFTLGNDTTICSEDTLLLDLSIPGASFLWQDNSTNSFYEVTTGGTYSVVVSVDNCSSSESIVVELDECDISLEMPNVFTPNNDKKNDVFTPVISKGIMSMTTVIFNRWGEQVFKSETLQIDWSGDEMPDGTYFWIVDAMDANNRPLRKEGFVSIFR